MLGAAEDDEVVFEPGGEVRRGAVGRRVGVDLPDLEEGVRVPSCHRGEGVEGRHREQKLRESRALAIASG